MPAENRVWITNVAPGDCIPLLFDLGVAYENATGANGATGAGCPAAGAPGDQNAPPGGGTHTFRLTHAAPGANHTITAALKDAAGNQLTGCSVGSVGIGAPCPIGFGEGGGINVGPPPVPPNGNLIGTFEPETGNGVFLLVEEPAKLVDGVVQPPRVVFAGAAEVKVTAGPPKKGQWKHPAIQAAKQGYHVRALLTKDGAVKAAVRAVFK
jgi:hypothetical protein